MGNGFADFLEWRIKGIEMKTRRAGKRRAGNPFASGKRRVFLGASVGFAACRAIKVRGGWVALGPFYLRPQQRVQGGTIRAMDLKGALIAPLVKSPNPRRAGQRRSAGKDGAPIKEVG